MIFIDSFFSQSSNNSSIPTISTYSEIVPIGNEAFLRLPNSNDSKQVILLAPTTEIAAEIEKAFLVNDTFGLLDLASKGVFGVSNGTKVLVIDKQGVIEVLYRVRILQGVHSVDSDKIGKSGWILRSFISNN